MAYAGPQQVCVECGRTTSDFYRVHPETNQPSKPRCRGCYEYLTRESLRSRTRPQPKQIEDVDASLEGE